MSSSAPPTIPEELLHVTTQLRKRNKWIAVCFHEGVHNLCVAARTKQSLSMYCACTCYGCAVREANQKRQLDAKTTRMFVKATGASSWKDAMDVCARTFVAWVRSKHSAASRPPSTAMHTLLAKVFVPTLLQPSRTTTPSTPTPIHTERWQVFLETVFQVPSIRVPSYKALHDMNMVCAGGTAAPTPCAGTGWLNMQSFVGAPVPASPPSSTTVSQETCANPTTSSSFPTSSTSCGVVPPPPPPPPPLPAPGSSSSSVNTSPPSSATARLPATTTARTSGSGEEEALESVSPQTLLGESLLVKMDDGALCRYIVEQNGTPTWCTQSIMNAVWARLLYIVRFSHGIFVTLHCEPPKVIKNMMVLDTPLQKPFPRLHSNMVVFDHPKHNYWNMMQFILTHAMSGKNELTRVFVVDDKLPEWPGNTGSSPRVVRPVHLPQCPKQTSKCTSIARLLVSGYVSVSSTTGRSKDLRMCLRSKQLEQTFQDVTQQIRAYNASRQHQQRQRNAHHYEVANDFHVLRLLNQDERVLQTVQHLQKTCTPCTVEVDVVYQTIRNFENKSIVFARFRQFVSPVNGVGLRKQRWQTSFFRNHRLPYVVKSSLPASNTPLEHEGVGDGSE